MSSWQARCFNAYARIIIRRRNWGGAAALARRARRLFGAPPVLQWLAVRGLVSSAETTSAGIRGEWLAVPSPSAGQPSGIVMYVHGGGYVSCSSATHRTLTAALARLTQCRVFSVDYRVAPETRFPGALEDVLRAYHWLVTVVAPGVPVAIAGESAGGGLVLALAQHARSQGWPLPACVAALSPWIDLTGRSASCIANDGRCDMFRPENIGAFATAYLDNASPLDSRASPLFGDMRGLPPVLLQVGSTELLFDDARQLHERLLAAGGESRLSVYDSVAHAWQLLTPFVPEATQALQEVADFVLAAFARQSDVHAGTTTSTTQRIDAASAS